MSMKKSIVLVYFQIESEQEEKMMNDPIAESEFELPGAGSQDGASNLVSFICILFLAQLDFYGSSLQFRKFRN